MAEDVNRHELTDLELGDASGGNNSETMVKMECVFCGHTMIVVRDAAWFILHDPCEKCGTHGVGASPNAKAKGSSKPESLLAGRIDKPIDSVQIKEMSTNISVLKWDMESVLQYRPMAVMGISSRPPCR